MTTLSAGGRAWTTLRAQVIAEEDVCGLCRRWVDKSLINPHPGAPQVDHIVPVVLAPHLVMVRSNLRLVHRLCNLKRGTAGAPKRRPSRRGSPVLSAAQPDKRPAPSRVFGPLSTSRKW
jgi:5-methylcytosine-specific restriction endonuclease McrA